MPPASGRLGRARRERLQREAGSLGPALPTGRLHDLGLYPAVVESGGAGDKIYGEVILFAVPDAAFAWLDLYEGVRADGVNRFGFQRVPRPVVLVTGETDAAWIYVYQGSIGGSVHIAGGRWVNSLGECYLSGFFDR